jgi:peroxiredoxin
MKYSLIPLFLLLCIIGYGQDTTVKKQIRYTETKMVRTVFNENTIVKDSTGKQLAYSEWKPKYDSGDYTFSRKDINDTVYTLKWFSPELKKRQHDTAPPPRLSPFFKNGEKIKSFNAKDIEGNKIELEQFRDKVVVINFFVTGDCASCKREMKAVNEALTEFGDRVVFLPVTNSSKKEVKEFLKSSDQKFIPISDGRHIADLYGINKFPLYVVVDGEGIVRFHTYGTSPKNVEYIKKTVIAIIKEKGTSF